MHVQLCVDVVYTCTHQESLFRDRKCKSEGLCLLFSSLIKMSLGDLLALFHRSLLSLTLILSCVGSVLSQDEFYTSFS